MTIENINLLNPDFLISCRELTQSKEIYTIMRKMGIKKSFGYAMLYRPELLRYKFLKIGMSCPDLNDREYQVGERIVRQLSWVPGWQGDQPKTSNGLDFWLNIQNSLISSNQLPKSFNKNDIEVGVWNVSERMSNSDFIPEQERYAAAWVEGALAKQHKDLYNKLPPLNYVDPSTNKSFTGTHVSRHVFESLFYTN